jgi:hypothetical protein
VGGKRTQRERAARGGRGKRGVGKMKHAGDDHGRETRAEIRTETGMMNHSAADHRCGSAMKMNDRWIEILRTNVADDDEETVHDARFDPQPEHHEHRQKKSVEDAHQEQQRAIHDAEA